MLAQNPITNPALGELGTKKGLDFVQKFVPSLVGFTLLIGALVFFFMVLIGAVRWISSGGEKASIESARGTITNALIGLVLVFSVFAIVKVIEIFFNINLLVLDIGPLRIR